TAVQFSREMCRWRILGAAADIRRTDERTAILDELKEAGEPMSSSDIAGAIGVPSVNVRKLLSKMVKAGEITKTKRRRYQHPEVVTGDQSGQKAGHKPDGQNSGQNDVCDRSSQTPGHNGHNGHNSQKDIISQEDRVDEFVTADVIAQPRPPVTTVTS